MYLTKTQIAGLQWAAGQIKTMPKSNTLDSLHSRNLLTVSAQSLHMLTAAGQEELLSRGLDMVTIDLSTDDKIPHCPHGCGQLQNADDAWICPECGDEWASDFYGARYALKSDMEHQAEERLGVKLFQRAAAW